MRTITTMAAAALLLAACSGKDGGNSSSGSSAAGTRAEQAPASLTQEPSNGAAPIAPPSPSPSPSESALAALPAAFQGRWGMNGADCDPAKADAAKGLMTIAADRLTFYESRGTPATLHQVAPGSVAFDLAMSGEGQSWREPTRLTLSGDGRTLVRQATGSPDRAGSFTYSRCPAR